MENIIGGLLVVGLIAFAIWRQRNDRERHGEVSPKDRKNTYIAVVIWFALLLLAFKFYVPVYITIIAIFYVYSQAFSMGTGKRGLYRQIRDGGFIACVASIPICLIWWFQHGQT